MSSEIDHARNHFIQGLSRITHFWGFPRAMGAVYGVIYLSEQPVSLNTIVEQVGITKGAVSTNVKNLERLGMIHKHLFVGDRKDYYTAETDFWRIVKGILKEREKNEFDIALRSVGESLETIASIPAESESTEFMKQRLSVMKNFFDVLDSLVSLIIQMDEAQLQAVMAMLPKGGESP